MTSVSVLILSLTDGVAGIYVGTTIWSSFSDPTVMVVMPATLFDVKFSIISPAKYYLRSILQRTPETLAHVVFTVDPESAVNVNKNRRHKKLYCSKVLVVKPSILG